MWTEPHSRRIKVRLTVQSEVQAGAIMEQTFVVEYVVHTQMCDDCHRTEAKDTWNCVVQLRQKVRWTCETVGNSPDCATSFSLFVFLLLCDECESLYGVYYGTYHVMM